MPTSAEWTAVLTKLLAGQVSCGRTGDMRKSDRQVTVDRAILSFNPFINRAKSMAGGTPPTITYDDALAVGRIQDAFDVLGAIEWTTTFRDNSLDVEANRLRQDLRHLMQAL